MAQKYSCGAKANTAVLRCTYRFFIVAHYQDVAFNFEPAMIKAAVELI
jgi:hypothetical protein